MSEGLDPRWDSMVNRHWKCECGQAHFGLFDLGCDLPDYWRVADGISPNSAAIDSDHFASEDFCVLEGKYFLIRCVLPLPLVGAEDTNFAYGVWSTLSKANFEIYRDGFDDGEYEPGLVWTGWLSNRLQGYPDTVNLPCHVLPRSGRQRPELELADADHPLVKEQREGIGFDRLVEIFSYYGHRPRRGALGLVDGGS